MIASTFFNAYRSSGLQELPRLTERERENVIAAMDAGELVAVAVVTPDHLERFCAEPDDGARATIDNRLGELADELDTLREIVRKVMAEKQPADFRYRILDSLNDAVDLLERAQNATEDL